MNPKGECEMRKPSTLILLAALVLGGSQAAPALAKSSARVRLDTVADASLDGALVRVRIQAKSRDRVDLRFDVHRAETGLALEVWVADADGAQSFAGDLTEDDGTPGEYRLRIRTDKGDALPGGAATAGDLAGRAVEVRDADGNVVAAGEIPSAGRRKNQAKRGAAGTTSGGADDPATHDALDDNGVDDPATHDLLDDSGGSSSGGSSTGGSGNSNSGKGKRGGGTGGGADDPANHG